MDSKERLTFGQRAADVVASFGGSWPFIWIFLITMAIWMILNSAEIQAHPFDPYPYILLNLILSCLAAIQAPIIMMSNNRQEIKARAIQDETHSVVMKQFDMVQEMFNQLSEKHDRLHEKMEKIANESC